MAEIVWDWCDLCCTERVVRRVNAPFGEEVEAICLVCIVATFSDHFAKIMNERKEENPGREHGS